MDGTSSSADSGSATPARGPGAATALRAALSLALGPAVALGLARFSYALVLPSMRGSLHWSFATAGSMNTANAVGYLMGALAAVPIGRRLKPQSAFLWGLAASAASLGLSATTSNVPVLAGLRYVAGFSSAVTFLLGAAMVAHLGRGETQRQATLVLGVYFGGVGAGVLAAGLVLPELLGTLRPEVGWRIAWLVLGVLAVAALAASCRTVRRTAIPAQFAQRGRWSAAPIWPLLLSYGLYGVGSMVYMTFIVALLRQGGARTLAVAAFWVLLGAACVASGFLWPALLTRMSGGRAPALLIGLVTAAAVLPVVSPALVMTLVSATLFGGCCLAVVTAVTESARRSLHQRRWTGAVAALTVCFAVGQSLGPLLAGLLSDSAGGVRAGLLLGVAVLVPAVLIALLQRAAPNAEENATRSLRGPAPALFAPRRR